MWIVCCVKGRRMRVVESGVLKTARKIMRGKAIWHLLLSTVATATIKEKKMRWDGNVVAAVAWVIVSVFLLKFAILSCSRETTFFSYSVGNALCPNGPMGWAFFEASLHPFFPPFFRNAIIDELRFFFFLPRSAFLIDETNKKRNKEHASTLGETRKRK